MEKAEKNKKAQLAYSFDIALQNEFTMDENIALARRFVQEHFVSKGMIADLAVHEPDKENGIPNPHFHVLTTMRPLNPDGTWGNKQRREYALDEYCERIRDELAAGDTLEILAQWVKDGSVDSGRDCAEITFISEGDFTIEKTEPTKTVAAGGSAGGWPKMPLRAELAPAVLPCFPENVREAIKPVKKISAISNTEQVETEETIWIPSRREYCKPNPMEKSGVMYDGTFDGTRYPIARRGAWTGITCWTRSRNGDNFYVITNPANEGNSSCSSACGIIIGFCI